MPIPDGVLDDLRIENLRYRFLQMSSPYRVHVDTTSALLLIATDGELCLEYREDGETRKLDMKRGSIALLLHGDGIYLSCGDVPGFPEASTDQVQSFDAGGNGAVVEHGDDPTAAEVLIGRFTFARSKRHPLIGALPSSMCIRPMKPMGWGWLKTCVDMLRMMPRTHPTTSTLSTARIAEIVFIHALVQHARSVMQDGSEDRFVQRWIKALNDPNLGPVLVAMHRHPNRDWTVSKLSREAMLSRTAFTERFKGLLGSSPMRYLRRLRLSEAQRLLENDPAATVAEAAHVAGYTSTSSFSQAFKEHVGTSPGDYQRSVHE